MLNAFFDFVGGESGAWKVTQQRPILGESLERVSHLKIQSGSLFPNTQGRWALKGFISNVRYAEKLEREKLLSLQPELGRPTATFAALIPIKKSDEWWNLAQDERRKIFEQQSHHTETGIKYLPAIARKLYHCRDIGEPFDFLTWFEFAPEHSDFFEELVGRLRASEEWRYVVREVDIRLEKAQ